MLQIMESKHLYVLCTAVILFHNQFGYVDNRRITHGPMAGITLHSETGDACRPWERLYRGKSKTADIAKIDQEAEALEFLFQLNKWVNPGNSRKTLVKSISTNVLKSPRLINNGQKSAFTKALGVFGGVWSLLAKGFTINSNEMTGDILRRAMHEGMKIIKAGMLEKIEELSVTPEESTKIKELMSLLEVCIAHLGYFSAQKIKFSIKNFFSKWYHLLKKSLIGNFFYFREMFLYLTFLKPISD